MHCRYISVGSNTCILWFRNDLRLADNSALWAACELRARIVPVFVWSPEEYGAWSPGEASRWWLARALESLDRSIRSRGGILSICAGDSLATLREVANRVGANHIFWNRRYEPAIRDRDAEIKKVLRAEGYGVQSFNSSLLNEPHTVSTGDGRPYKVYTPYWKKVKDRDIEAPRDCTPEAINFVSEDFSTNEFSTLDILPQVQWYSKFEAKWDVSESGAELLLEGFAADAIDNYDSGRDIPSILGTSKLSPYLHYGLIGPRQVVAKVNSLTSAHTEGAAIYLKEIYWREFAYNVIYHFPHTQDRPLQRKFESFPWEDDPAILDRWKHGLTGYPIVDAGMRELWETGWMHNRVRMIVSSFLVKHLLQNWHAGARWFWDTLVDADLASNSLGWQWSGGCGADAAPYFRIFNPMTQGKKFDPEGHYVRRWVPELTRVPNKYIHEPWLAPEPVLEAWGVSLGENYPKPIVSHEFGRKRALEALAKIKEST